MSKPLVSIIVPVYNVEEYLQRCLDSLISQSYYNIEILLVDDGSTDLSGIICENYKNKDSRISVIHKENGGLSDARNVGLEVCLGDYIIFVDSDDYIHPEMVSGMVATALRNNADIVECDINVSHGKDVSKYQNNYNVVIKKILNHDDAVYSCLNYSTRIMVWNKLYKKELFESIRFPFGKLHEDEFTTPYIIDCCNSYVIIKNKYYTYFQRNNSIMNSKFNSDRLCIMEAYEKRLTYFSEKYKNRYNDVILYHYFVVCVNLKLLMGRSFKGSNVEKRYIEIREQLLKKKALKISRKIKIILYCLFPDLVIGMKKIK